VDRPPLDVEALRHALSPRWSRVDVVAETASTNADLLSRSDQPDRSVLAAEFQNAGRGRFDRVWTSPPGAGLTVSALFRPAVPLVRWGWLPLLTGVAVVEAVGEIAGVRAALKWPNDVLVDGAKLAGILVQGDGDVAVVGVGCNVSTTADELPVDTATSLHLLGADVDRTALLVALLGRLDARVAQWVDCGGDAEACGLAAAYRDVCTTIGQRVRVTVGDGSVREGEVHDVDSSGHLVLHQDEGTDVITAGDVEHLRPAPGTG
jgi:BirA family biotin operon repressor/biotin-[acetyl-CoA-carboxylase] ligase